MGEGVVGFAEQAVLIADDGAVVDSAGIALGGARQVLFGQKTGLHQQVRADQQRLTGKGGETLVGRVAEARGAQGQDLPEMLARAGQEIDKIAGGGAQVADPVGGRERGGMDQDAGEPRRFGYRFAFGCFHN